jgi:hypothetical protein
MRRPAEESGTALDKTISYVAIALGCIGFLMSLNGLLSGSEGAQGLALISLAYLLGGLLNVYLSAIWKRPNVGWPSRLLVVIVKPPLVIFLFAAIVVAFIVMVCLRLGWWPGD